MKGTILLANAEEAVDRAHLEAALSSGRKLRVKFGIDPTAPDLHLGHAVPLRVLRTFQDAGHQAVLVIGDFTAMIGDPTGKSATRPVLTDDEVEANLATYLAQAGMILDLPNTEIRRNSEWLAGALPQLINLFSKVSIQQVLHRADFKKRMEADLDISMLEAMYPLLQGYDSFALKADIEIGGSDQLFNLLMGRRVQRALNQAEQDIITLPLIEGTDGTKKMSKSLGNYIALTDPADAMFGKIMSIPDTLMPKYFALLTDIATPTDLTPRDTKALLARTIADMYHGIGAGESAEASFIKMFSEGHAPENAPEWNAPENPITATDLVAGAGKVTKSEAKRLITQGGIKLDGVALHDPMAKLSISDGALLQIGRLKSFKVRV